MRIKKQKPLTTTASDDDDGETVELKNDRGHFLEVNLFLDLEFSLVGIVILAR